MTEKDFRNSLKRIFTGYKRITPKIEKSLAEMGIFIARKKNHIILVSNSGKKQKSAPISSTGSDKREGLNIVSKLIRRFFYQET